MTVKDFSHVSNASVLNRKMEDKNMLLIQATQKMYPGHFFLHIHIAKTGGHTFASLFAVTDNAKENCGSNYGPDEVLFKVGDYVDSNNCTVLSHELKEIDEVNANKSKDCFLTSWPNHHYEKCDRRFNFSVSNLFNRYNAKSEKKIHAMTFLRDPLQLVIIFVLFIFIFIIRAYRSN